MEVRAVHRTDGGPEAAAAVMRRTAEGDGECPMGWVPAKWGTGEGLPPFCSSSRTVKSDRRPSKRSGSRLSCGTRTRARASRLATTS